MISKSSLVFREEALSRLPSGFYGRYYNYQVRYSTDEPPVGLLEEETFEPWKRCLDKIIKKLGK